MYLQMYYFSLLFATKLQDKNFNFATATMKTKRYNTIRHS